MTSFTALRLRRLRREQPPDRYLYGADRAGQLSPQGTLTFTASSRHCGFPRAPTYAVKCSNHRSQFSALQVNLRSTKTGGEDSGGASRTGASRIGYDLLDSKRLRSLVFWSTIKWALAESRFTVDRSTVTNTPPTVATPIPDQTATVDTAFSYAFPSNTFADTDAGDSLTYAAEQSDGTALPAWRGAGRRRARRGTPRREGAGRARGSGFLARRFRAHCPVGLILRWVSRSIRRLAVSRKHRRSAWSKLR